MEAQKPIQPATAAKPQAKKEGSKVGGIKNAFLVIIACFIVAVCLFIFWFGHESHFEDGHPHDIWGTIYMGGVKACLAKNDIAGAQALCSKQKGSVAAVVSAALVRYEEMDKNTVLSKEQKIATLQKEVEEATALEMPALQQNLPIVATMTTLGTLVGLLGTVIGMIKSFQALAQSGAPDSTELSTGISEALINTAFGIATGAFAVISYNFYTNKIDNLTYAIDEIGFSIVQTFAATH